VVISELKSVEPGEHLIQPLLWIGLPQELVKKEADTCDPPRAGLR
jgi:hypothetical protein